MSFSQPLFILASPRSFTSLACTAIGQHPQAYGVPEINLFSTKTLQELVDFTKKKSNFIIHGLLRTVAQIYAGEQTIESIAMARRWLDRRIHLDTGEVYIELSRKVSPLTIVDKSPIYVKKKETLDLIRQTFPEAKYLYLTRHPKDQGKSMLKAPQAVAELIAANSFDLATEPPCIEPQYEWYKTQLRILDFLKTIPDDRQMRLRGEDLIEKPRQYLEKVSRWLNLTWNESTYQTMLRTEDSPYAKMGPYGCLWGNNPGFQKSPAFRFSSIELTPLEEPLPWGSQPRYLLPEVVKLAKQLGY